MVALSPVRASASRSSTRTVHETPRESTKKAAPPAPARTSAAAQIAAPPTATSRPSREVGLDARRAHSGNLATTHLRARLDEGLARGRAEPTGRVDRLAPRGPVALGQGRVSDVTTRPGADPAAPRSRRISVDDPLALAGDAPSTGRLGHPSLRRDLGKLGAGDAGRAVGEALRDRAGGRLPNSPEGFRENADGSHTFHGTSGDDHYTVAEAKNGTVTVTNDTTGATYSLTAAEAAQGVTIAAGAGDDRVSLDDSVRTPLKLEGGSGDDRLDASAARGDVQIEGGSGDDTLRGGAGNDAIAGGSGDDRIVGGEGNDQLLGQDGDDTLSGMDGDDYVQGGAGADRARGGEGSDAIYADRDDTHIDAGNDEAVDLIVAEQGSVAPTRIGATDQIHEFDPEATDAWLEAHPELAIDGSDDFVARTRADLGVMLGTTQGRGLLDDLAAGLRDDGDVLTLREKPLEDGAGGLHRGSTDEIEVGQWSETYADGTQRMPLPVLFHELVHAYQNHVSGYPEGSTRHENGSDVRNTELQATGLPWYDEHGDLHPANELPYTDNQFREELGLAPRTRYGAGDGAPTEHVAGDSDGCCDHAH